MMAMESPHIQAEAIDASAFPEVAASYDVRGVPRTVINDSVFFEGAAPEKAVLEKVFEALRQ